ncbi:hypothetical protein E8E11_001842 [Didymella keratinophila]|nr:hypothetical protein E8E11_001842 [Didymella keratinophila]
MAKRKRSGASPALSDTTPAASKLLKHQKKAVLARLTAAQKPLIAALRLGAGFERQKHSRRKKTAVQKKDTKALTRLDDEYRALKALDLEKVAEQHVRRTIAKVKSLKEHEALPESVRDIEKADNEQAKLNVLARLYKVAAVKKEVDALIDDLKEIVGGAEGAGRAEQADTARGAETKEKKRKVEESEGEEEDVDMLDLSDEDGVAARLLNARIAAPSSGEESDGSLSGTERPPSIGDSDSEDPDADLEVASDSESSSFGGFSASNSSDNAISRIAPPSDVSDSDSASSVSITTTKKPSKPTAAPTSSTFLPGLSHATYFSGDESASDLDEKPRKNRRGQRARQKIAEAKYGAKAKHIEKNERKKGWDAKRGAVDTDNGGRMNRKARREAEKGMKAKGGRGPVMSGENAAPLGKKRLGGGDGGAVKINGGAASAQGAKKGPKKDDTGPLHPSWEAAKKAKESKKLKIDLGGAKTAKKITFD